MDVNDPCAGADGLLRYPDALALLLAHAPGSPIDSPRSQRSRAPR